MHQNTRSSYAEQVKLDSDRHGTQWSKGLGILSFLLLCPLLFFYHYAAVFGIIGYGFGGFVNEASLLIFILSLFVFWEKIQSNQQRQQNDIVQLSFIGFAVVFFSVLVIHSFNSDLKAVTNGYTASMLQGTAAYIMILLFPLQSKIGRNIAIWSAAAMTLTALLFDYNENSIFTINNTQTLAKDSNVANYQSLARACLVALLISISLSSGRITRYILFLLGLSSIYVLGARTELFCLLAFMAVAEFLRVKTYATAILTLATVSLVATVTVVLVSAIEPDSRILALVYFSEDGSVIERSAVLENALTTISANPILGSFGSYIELGGPGYYAHNALSAWVDLGLIGFLLFVSSVILLWLSHIKNLLPLTRLSRQTQDSVIFSLGTTTIVTLLLFSKNFADPALPIAVAAYLRTRRTISDALAERTL